MQTMLRGRQKLSGRLRIKRKDEVAQEIVVRRAAGPKKMSAGTPLLTAAPADPNPYC